MYSVHCIKDNTFPFLIIQLFAWISFISNLERWLILLPNDSDDERFWWKSKVGCLQFSAGNLADCSSHSLQQLQPFSFLQIFIKLIVIITTLDVFHLWHSKIQFSQNLALWSLKYLYLRFCFCDIPIPNINMYVHCICHQIAPDF